MTCWQLPCLSWFLSKPSPSRFPADSGNTPAVSQETCSLRKLPLSFCYLHRVTLTHSTPSLESPLQSHQHGELSSFTPHFPPLPFPFFSRPHLAHTVGRRWHGALIAAFAPTGVSHDHLHALHPQGGTEHILPQLSAYPPAGPPASPLLRAVGRRG